MSSFHSFQTLAFGFIALLGCSLAGPIVSLDASTRVEGIVLPSTPQVEQFLGIPYAAPPIGALRFAAPQPVTRTGHIDATVTPASCMQTIPDDPTYNTIFPPEYSIAGGTSALISEDCLTLSVWKPAGNATKQPLPVLFFIHGGAFSGGSETVPYQIPSNWVQRTQNLIVVTINYRLNIFGFPNAAGLQDQNAGILDQRQAILWVRDHIAAFGGDPTRIVIWGQSAGAGSVDIQNYAYAKDPIVKGFIMDSGSVSMGLSGGSSTDHSGFNNIASKVGCRNSTTANADLACMRNVSAAAINKAMASGGGPFGGAMFAPVADGIVVFSDYDKRAATGQMSEAPAIMGNNAQDAITFASMGGGSASPASQTTMLNQMFVCPAIKAARARAANGRKSYRFLYSGNFTNVAAQAGMGAFHSSELPLLFGTHPKYRGNSTAFEYQVSAAMQDAWAAFISDPVNGLDKYGWPAWNATNGQVMVFGANGKAASSELDAGIAACR